MAKREIKVATIFKFEKIGDSIAGEYRGSRTVDTKIAEESLIHEVILENGDKKAFFAPVLLAQQLEDVEKGWFVEITYVSNIKGNSRNPMKEFSVIADDGT